MGLLGVIIEIVIAHATALGLALLWVSRRLLTEQHSAGTVWLLRSDDDGIVHGARASWMSSCFLQALEGN